MEAIETHFKNNTIGSLSVSELRELFGKLNHAGLIAKLIRKYPTYKSYIYEYIEYIDFVGCDLIVNNEVNPETHGRYQMFRKFDISKIQPFTNLKEYKIITENKKTLEDVRARYLDIVYDESKGYDYMMEDLRFALKIRREKYGTQFTFVFSGSVNSSQDLLLYYHNGLLHIKNRWSSTKNINKIFPVIFGQLDVLEVFNLESECLGDLASYKLDTLSYNVLNRYNLFKEIPNNIKKILFYTTTDKSKKNSILESESHLYTYDNVFPNITVLEYPVTVDNYHMSLLAKAFPNVKLFHSVNAYKVKTLGLFIDYHNDMIQFMKDCISRNEYNQETCERNLKSCEELVDKNVRVLGEHIMKVKEDVARGYELGIEVWHN